jgi:hypothetical protein
MSFTQFEDQNNISIRQQLKRYADIDSASFLVRHNIAKDEEGAKKISLFFSIIIFILAISISIFGYFGKTETVKPKYKISNEILQKLPPGVQYNIIKN